MKILIILLGLSMFLHAAQTNPVSQIEPIDQNASITEQPLPSTQSTTTEPELNALEILSKFLEPLENLDLFDKPKQEPKEQFLTAPSSELRKRMANIKDVKDIAKTIVGGAQVVTLYSVIRLADSMKDAKDKCDYFKSLPKYDRSFCKFYASKIYPIFLPPNF